MRIRVNFTYVTGLLDGIDVMTRHHHAHQHTWARCRHTHTGDTSVGQETQLPVSCSSRHGSKPIPPIPALHHWHAACEGLLSIPRALYCGRPRPPSIYKNNLSPTQFVLPSTYYTKCISITKTLSVTLLHIHIVALEQ